MIATDSVHARNGGAMRYVAAFALLSLCPTLVAQGSDLAKRYRATLDYEKAAGVREWTCGAEDVWAL